MTADFDSLPDLDDWSTMCKGYMDNLSMEMNENNLTYSPFKKLPPFESYQMISEAFYDTKQSNYDTKQSNSDLQSPFLDYTNGWEAPPLHELIGYSQDDYRYALLHTENDPEILNPVDPISCLPSPVKIEDEDEEKFEPEEEKFEPEDEPEELDDDEFELDDESLESALADNLIDLTDEKLIRIVDSNNFMNCSNYVSLDDILVKQPKKFNYLDFEHSYSARPEGYDGYSPPYSPASSSCSDKAARGTKRGRPPKKNTACKKIKQELCSEDEDVESPYTVSLVVPKITLALSPPPSPPTPPKRGRKPKNKSQVQKNKKTKNKNCPVPPKVLEEAIIKQQKKRNYITKSGRVTKVSHSVESTPSTSTQSSQNSSRCSSDNEDTADKRASHNQAERQRRQQLTDLFQFLRRVVPGIMSSPKASKVAILSEAAKCVLGLHENSRMIRLYLNQEKTEVARRISILQSVMR